MNDFTYTCRVCCYYLSDNGLCICKNPSSENFNKALIKEQIEMKCESCVPVFADFDLNINRGLQ